jgi:hypothetical protein
MTPTKIVLEQTATHIQLRVFAPETAKGSTVIGGTPFVVSPKPETVSKLRKRAEKYAKSFSIPFVDQTK